MTHLAAEIRTDALAVLEWLLEIAQESVVTCPGGWVKTLKSFMSMMGWAASNTVTKWTSESKASFAKSGKALPRQIQVLAQFLRAGLLEPDELGPGQKTVGMFPLWDVEKHMVPTRTNAFAHLNLFGSSRDEEGEMYIDREDRQRVFQKYFQRAIEAGVEHAKKEAGEAGRVATVLSKVLKDGMADYSGVDENM